MFTNYFSERLNTALSYLKPTEASSGDPASSNERPSDQLYKIPSTPLREGKNSLILTRSQCDNTCSANCLVHKRRKRKAKVNDTSSDLSLNSVETESTGTADQLDDPGSPTKATSSSGRKSAATTRTTMSSRRKGTTGKSTSKYSNHHAVFSDDEGIEDEQPEIVEHNYVNRYNYYENFSNLTEATRTIAASPAARRSFYPVIIGLLVVVLVSIFFLSTSQNFNSITDPENYARLFDPVDQQSAESNLRAIESFKQELRQSFSALNQRIDRVETQLKVHLQQQEQLSQRLDQVKAAADPKVHAKRIDQIVAELSSYKVQIDKLSSQFSSRFSLSSANGDVNCQFDDIRQLIKEALATYDADKTGIVDYASEFAGGEIVSTGCTESYDLKGASYKILGLPIWSPPNIPRFVIQPNSSPGQCWYFRGNKGSLVIKLSRAILPESFSYEHIPVRNAPDGHINSAPKHFEVRGLDGENADDNWLLGEFDYNKSGDPIQFFRFENTDRPVEYIEFNVLDNHGNEEFTCMYRIRVHGVKVDKEE